MINEGKKKGWFYHPNYYNVSIVGAAGASGAGAGAGSATGAGAGSGAATTGVTGSPPYASLTSTTGTGWVFSSGLAPP